MLATQLVESHYADQNHAEPMLPFREVAPFAEAAAVAEAPNELPKHWLEWTSAAELRTRLHRLFSDPLTDRALSDGPSVAPSRLALTEPELSWLRRLRWLLDMLASGRLSACVVAKDRSVSLVPREAWAGGSAFRLVLHRGFESASFEKPLFGTDGSRTFPSDAEFVELVLKASVGVGGTPLFVQQLPEVHPARELERSDIVRLFGATSPKTGGTAVLRVEFMWFLAQETADQKRKMTDVALDFALASPQRFKADIEVGRIRRLWDLGLEQPRSIGGTALLEYRSEMEELRKALRTPEPTSEGL